MKYWLPAGVIALFLCFGNANAQRTVDLQYYTPAQTPMLVSLPAGSLTLTRFETTAPAKLKSISIGFYSQPTAPADSAFVYLLPRQAGGGSFPYSMQPIMRVAVYVESGANGVKNINFTDGPNFTAPTSFYIGVQVSENFYVMMDADPQIPLCVTSDKDTVFSNTYAVNQGNGWAFGYRLNTTEGLKLMSDWYVGVKVDYYDENIPTMFTDVTNQAKLHLQTSGNTSTRIAWGDFNGDGFQDALWGNKLFKNNGDGTFDDVAQSAGFSAGSEVNMFADLDNDGDLDILCMPSNAYYRNEDGLFQIQPNPGFMPNRNTQAMTFIDINKDKLLDILVINGEYMYRKNPVNSNDSALVQGAAWQPYFYINSDDGSSFIDLRTTYMFNYQEGAYGRNPYDQQQQIAGYRPGTTAQCVDFDNDGDVDIFVGVDRLQPNYLLVNNGAGSFQTGGRTHNIDGVLKPNYQGLYGNTRGSDWGDFDGDGDMDMIAGQFVSPFGTDYSDLSGIWKNDGSPSFNFLNVPATESKIFYTDIYRQEAAYADFNNDGLLDFILTTGENCYYTRLYMQNPDHTFTDVTYPAGIDAHWTSGVAWVDYDNDGDMDLAIITENGLRLYKNNTPNTGNWAQFDLEGKTNNHHGVGARINVFAGGKKFIQDVGIGRGAGNQNPLTAHFGLGAISGIDSVQVRWPNGKIDSRTDVDINTRIKILEYVKPDTTVSVPPVAGANDLDLQQNYPNPFSTTRSASTSIAYNLPGPAAIRVEIYSSAGMLVKVLVDKQQGPGTYYVQWDGRDQLGAQVPTGNYQYILKSNGSILSKRMVVLK